MPAYINYIGSSTPKYAYRQGELVEFMLRPYDRVNGTEVHLKALYRASGIRQRFSVLQDYGQSVEDYTFYPNNKSLEPFPDTSSRMTLFKQEASKLGCSAVADCFAQTHQMTEEIGSVTHLIAVSCTGFYAPGLDIDLVKNLGLKPTVQRVAINYMGCYAALCALRTARSIVEADAGAKVLIVCVELCTIHFQKEDSEDNRLANALFGDGASAVILSSTRTSGVNLRITESYSNFIPEGETDMTWTIGNLGFEMKLSKYVPDILKDGVRKLTEDIEGIRTADYFAIHPGGKKILESIAAELDLVKEDLKYSYQVLKQFGNMSSPTVLFVLQSIVRDLSRADRGKSVCTMAFGPGLTLEVTLLEVA